MCSCAKTSLPGGDKDGGPVCGAEGAAGAYLVGSRNCGTLGLRAWNACAFHEPMILLGVRGVITPIIPGTSR